MGMNFGVHSPVYGVPKNVGLEKVYRGVVVLVRLDNQLRQPVRMFCHPAGIAGSKTWIAFCSERIRDFVLVERLRQPFGAADLSHADTGAKPLGQLGEYRITLL